LSVTAAEGVLVNDLGPSAQRSAQLLFAPDPSIGTVTLNPDGSFVFAAAAAAPPPNPVQFGYTLVIGSQNVGSAIVTLYAAAVVNGFLPKEVSCQAGGDRTIWSDDGMT